MTGNWLMECSYLKSSCILRNVENTLLLGYTDLQKQCSAVKNAASYWFKPVDLLKLFWWSSVCRGHERLQLQRCHPCPCSRDLELAAAGSSTVQSHKLRHDRIIFFSQCLALPRLWQCYFLKALSDTSSISFLLSLKESRCVLDCPITPSKRRRRMGEQFL